MSIRPGMQAPVNFVLRRSSGGLIRLTSRLCWGVHITGLETLPPEGGYLLASTHESFLDPLIIGSFGPKPLVFLARDTLFKRSDGSRSGLRTWLRDLFLITELTRDGAGVEGMRVSLEVLEQGLPLLVFPEGTRSRDGSVQAFRPGVGMLALKAKVPVVPVSLDGTRGPWPRGQSRPSVSGGPIRLAFGEPVLYERPMKARAVAADVRDRVLDLRRKAARDGAAGPEVTGDGSPMGGAAGDIQRN